MSGRSVFVLGTDTGVGKTSVSLALIRCFRRRGLCVGVMKPCETGSGDDAEQLISATGRTLPLDLVNPYRLALAAAPAVAASRSHTSIDLGTIASAHKQIAVSSDVTVIEGAGGLLVPLTARETLADLAVRLQAPILLVARTRLGTINHTLLTLEAARARGLRVLGTVFSRTERAIGPEEEESLELLRAWSAAPSFGTLPWLPVDVRGDEKRFTAEMEAHLRIDTLLDALGLISRTAH